MKFTLDLHKNSEHSSVIWHDSSEIPGVRYSIRGLSLAQRIELTRKTRELLLRHEFLKAGDRLDQLEASLSELLVRRLYIEWGLIEIRGLNIDGQPATVDLLIEKGPEALTEEVAAAIRAGLELTEQERKNS